MRDQYVQYLRLSEEDEKEIGKLLTPSKSGSKKKKEFVRNVYFPPDMYANIHVCAENGIVNAYMELGRGTKAVAISEKKNECFGKFEVRHDDISYVVRVLHANETRRKIRVVLKNGIISQMLSTDPNTDIEVVAYDPVASDDALFDRTAADPEDGTLSPVTFSQDYCEGINSREDLVSYIMDARARHSVDFCSGYFDLPVYMMQADIISAYADLVSWFNGERVVRIDKDGNVCEELIPAGMFNEIYDGNCAEFLLRFSERANEVGIWHFPNDETTDTFNAIAFFS